MASRLRVVLAKLRILEADLSVAKLVKAVVAEFLGTLLFVFAASGAVTSGCHVSDVVEASGNGNDTALVYAEAGSCAIQSNFVLNIALAFGFALFVVIYITASFSGGHINPAVSLAALLAGHASLIRAALYVVAQCTGAIVGSALLKAIDPNGFRAAAGVANAVNTSTGVTALGAWGVETILTFVLVFTVFAATDTKQATITPHLPILAPFSIAMVVFFAHFVAIPIDGCSLNPARSLGPAVVTNTWDSHWVFWAGPLAGAILATLIYELAFNFPESQTLASEEYERLPEAEVEA